MNVSKSILAYLREGDFAHPGEIEAIHLAMGPIKKNPDQLLLDVGCGLGGTAHYLQKQGWGQVIGIDLDGDVILHAKQHYPDIQFYKTDAMDVDRLFADKKFDVIYLFSSFFCFPQQELVLQKLQKISQKTSRLVIFDYSLLTDEVVNNPFTWSNSVKHCYPIHLERFKQSLSASGWRLTSSLDVSTHFKLWYRQLLDKFAHKSSEIIEKFGPTICNAMRAGYEQLLVDMDQGRIGGIIIYAERSS